MLRRLTVARATKNRSRANALCAVFSATFCGCWSLLRKALIRKRKTSYTAGTLGEIKIEYMVNYN
jgi:hypothetical protein